jgi:flagellar biosynthesis/type III secretory pathway chaperone
MLDTLSRQADLLGELIRVGQEQRSAIDAGRINELLAVLAAKQTQLEELGEIRERLNVWKATVEQPGFWPDQATRELAKRLRDQSAAAFDELIEMEQGCEHALTSSRDQIQIRLKQLDSGRSAADAYAAHGSQPITPRVDFSSIG